MAFMGRGWAYPVSVQNEQHGLLYADGPEKVRESIWIILDTEPGERIMRPSFGCGLRRYLGEPNTVAVRALVRHDVEQALSAWEPRVSVSSVAVTPGPDPSLIEIAVAYVHVRTSRPDNLVYPFYLTA